MPVYPVTLGIAFKWRNARNLSQKETALSPEVRAKVLERDDHICQFCGFHAKKYQDVHFLDEDFTNQTMDNMATACIFCHQCFNLDKVAAMRSGVLVWMPEIEQKELHHIARAIYVSRISQGSMAETAKKALEIIMARKDEAKARIGTDDPNILALVMRDFLGLKQYAGRAEKLDGIRLFPLDRRIINEGGLEFNQFPQILAYWRSKDGPFGHKVPGKWKNFYAQLTRAAA